MDLNNLMEYRIYSSASYPVVKKVFNKEERPNVLFPKFGQYLVKPGELYNRTYFVSILVLDS